MKHLTRFFALVLALTLAFSLCLPAFALGSSRLDPEKPFSNSAFFDYKDYRIHYRTFPAENAKDQIFMIHGFALSSYCFVALPKSWSRQATPAFWPICPISAIRQGKPKTPQNFRVKN